MLEVHLHTLQLNEPFRIAHGVSDTRQVVRVAAEGAIGEAPFVPYYGEDPEQTVNWLREMEWQEVKRALPKEGPRAGLLALDLLRQDWKGKREKLPLSASAERFLGGEFKQTTPIHACRSFSIPTELSAFVEKVRQVGRQFRVLKLKLGSGNVDFDEAVVAYAREAARRSEILVDVNGGWSVSDTLLMLRRLRKWEVALIEQPVHHQDGIEPWEEVRAKAISDGPPLFADESAQTAADVPRLAAVAAGVNVKLLKCGSFGGAMEMIQIAHRHRLGVLLGCMIESAIGVTAAAHLSPWAHYVDLDGHLYVANNDYEGIAVDSAGVLVMPTEPGIGVKRKRESLS